MVTLRVSLILLCKSLSDNGLEELLFRVEPLFLEAYVVTLFREYYPAFGGYDAIVAREVGMWRADSILQAEAHKHGALDALSEVL